MTAFWALAGRARAESAQPPAAAPEPPPEEPKDCLVILTFENGRRDPSCASLMTAENARTEAELWRRRKPGRAEPRVHHRSRSQDRGAVVIILPCPVCPVEIEVSEADPDASLSDLWSHLLRHPAPDARQREQMFLRAQQNAREVP